MSMIRPVYAEVNFGDSSINPIAKFDTITKFVNLLVPIMMLVGGLITLFMLLYGAFTYLTSEGNADKVKKSQSILKSAVLGLFLIVVSFIVTKIIGYVLKVNMPL
jgi:fumarate reductase subunit C